MPLRRRPQSSSVPGYPPLSAHGQARRRFLKLCALSSAGAALGLSLVGCPGGPAGGGGTGGGGSVSGGDWVPWDGPERLAGEAPLPLGAPVALVVGGGPISVEFQDGVPAELVVAAVVSPRRGADVAADFVQRQAEHVKLVQEAAGQQASGVLLDAASLEAFEQVLRDALNGTVLGGYVDEVSAARAQAPRPSSPAPAREAEAADVAHEAAPAEEAVSAEEEPVAPAPRGPRAGKLWTICRRPGCTTCGAK